jgi:glycosyltransferase involved in cell wall biosynthesis
VPVKNHAFFLEAAKKMKDRGLAARFFVVGDGFLRKRLEAQCQQLQLDHTYFPAEPRKALITFTSWVTEVDRVMAGLDVVALTSISEGTPISLLEAQASGIPVVALEAGGTPDIMRHGETGFVAAQGDLDGFTEFLIQLAKNAELRYRMGAQGKQFAQLHFDKMRQVKMLSLLYTQLINVQQHTLV